MTKATHGLTALVPFAALALFAACANGVTGPVTGGGPVEAEVKQLRVVPAQVTIRLGESVQLWAEFEGRDGTPLEAGDAEVVYWASSRPDVAEISESGVVQGLAEGEALIISGRGQFTAYSNVTVLPRRKIDPPTLFARAGR